MFFFNIGEVKNTGALPVGTTELQFRVDDQCSGTTETLTIVVNNIVSLQLYLSQAKITKKKPVSQAMNYVYRLLTVAYEPQNIVSDSLSLLLICKTIFNGCKI